MDSITLKQIDINVEARAIKANEEEFAMCVCVHKSHEANTSIIKVLYATVKLTANDFKHHWNTTR